MTKARKFGINTPYVLFVDYENRKIYMQYVANSMKMRDFLNKDPPEQSSSFFIFSFFHTFLLLEILEIMDKIGQILAKMHDIDLIHGDLTTSNILITKSITEQSHILYFIDFGLSYQRNTIEDKAVDLYVLERAFLSSHPNMEKEVYFFFYKTKNKRVC